MIFPISSFKVRLIEHPKIRDKEGDGQRFKNFGTFKIGKKYRVYSIFSFFDPAGKGFTEFLLADEEGLFLWINAGICRKA